MTSAVNDRYHHQMKQILRTNNSQQIIETITRRVIIHSSPSFLEFLLPPSTWPYNSMVIHQNFFPIDCNNSFLNYICILKKKKQTQRTMHFARVQESRDSDNGGSGGSNAIEFSGCRDSGRLFEVMNRELHHHENIGDKSIILALLQQRYDSIDLWKSIPCWVFNTARIKGQSTGSDNRSTLRTSWNFHGRQIFSSVQLNMCHEIEHHSCKFAKCLMFLKVGQENLVLVRMIPSASADLEKYAFLRNTEIGEFIASEYTILEKVDGDSNFLKLLPLNEIRRQEQMCPMENNLILVNHFCWSNVFSSDD